MTAFNRLIKLLNEIGFEPDNHPYKKSGSYGLSTESLSVTVYIGCSSITIFIEQPDRYKVCFFYSYTLIIKGLIMSFKELEKMLLISIIRNSFLTEEEQTKASDEFLEMFL